MVESQLIVARRWSARSSLAWIAALALALVETGCLTEKSEPATASGKTPVLVAVEPIADLVERVGGDRVVVFALTPQGKDPETYAPTPGDLKSIVASKVFFRVGLPVEERFANNIASLAPSAKSVDLRAELEPLPDAHSRGESDDDFDDDSIDAHVWTSPANARAMVPKIADALAELDPDFAESYRSAAAKLDEELRALQEETSERLVPWNGRAFFVFHPAYGYYAREFHLEQVAIEFEGKAPRPKDLQKLVERAKREGVRALIVQPEFNRSAAEALAAEAGAALVEHSPLQKDYFATVRSLTDAIVGSFGEKTPVENEENDNER